MYPIVNSEIGTNLLSVGSGRSGNGLRPHRYRARPALQESDHGFVRWVSTVDIHEVLGQQIIAFAHQSEEDVHVVQSGEDHGLVFREIGQVFLEVDRMIGPVHRRVHVMADVVTIVPTPVVELHVDTGDAVLEVVPGFIRINEGVLHPIAGHGHKAEDQEGNDEYR